MYALSLPGLTEWIIILFVIGIFWLVISTVVSIAKNTQMEMTHKLFWVIIVVVAPILGSIVYYVFNKNLSGKS